MCFPVFKGETIPCGKSNKISVNDITQAIYRNSTRILGSIPQTAMTSKYAKTCQLCYCFTITPLSWYVQNHTQIGLLLFIWEQGIFSFMFLGLWAQIQTACKMSPCFSWILNFYVIIKARRFLLPDGPGQVKLPIGQVDLDRFFFFSSYKQIEEFQNSWSRASDDFEKRRALFICWIQNK